MAQGRKWTVETHPKKDLIIKALVRGDQPLRTIGDRFGVSKTCLRDYLHEKLLPEVAEARLVEAKQDGKSADHALKARLEYVITKMMKLYEACDEYLQDPENPEKYDLGPRAWEFEVGYYEEDPETKKRIIRSANLQYLLGRIVENGYGISDIKFTVTDPRKLIVATANAIGKELEIIGKLEGKITENVTNLTLINQAYLDFKDIVLKATVDHPEIQERILNALTS